MLIHKTYELVNILNLLLTNRFTCLSANLLTWVLVHEVCQQINVIKSDKALKKTYDFSYQQIQ